MNMHFEELLDKVTNFMETEAKTETVIGDAFKLGEFTCLPVIRVGLGFGTGGGEGDDPKKVHGEGMGAGGGMGLEPIGFLVTKGDQIEFLSTKTNKGLAAAFEKVPELINKYMDIRAEKREPVLS
ncbi:MAG: spore germination protein GerW family protein [Saprospiraceae bacterium]|nr:spore germination protein GerW family protein [Saprospiraceae bacterium]